MTVKVKIPLAVGVPLTTPALLSERPVGSDPEVSTKVGAGEPLAVNVYEYPMPTRAGDVGLAAVNSGMLPTTIVTDDGALVPTLFVAVTANVELLTLVGVPLTTPADERESPAGNDPDETANVGDGLPDAVKVYEYGELTAAGDGGLAAVMTGTTPIATVNELVDTVPKAFVAVTVTLKLVILDDDPLNTPVTGVKVKPVGSEEIDRVGAGLPDAAKVYE